MFSIEGYDLERFLYHFYLMDVYLLFANHSQCKFSQKFSKHQSFIHRHLGLVQGASIIHTCTYAPALMSLNFTFSIIFLLFFLLMLSKKLSNLNSSSHPDKIHCLQLSFSCPLLTAFHLVFHDYYY